MTQEKDSLCRICVRYECIKLYLYERAWQYHVIKILWGNDDFKNGPEEYSLLQQALRVAFLNENGIYLLV